MKAYYSTANAGPEVSQYGDFPDTSAGKGQLLFPDLHWLQMHHQQAYR
jgi:hypothetical protein